MREPSCWIGRQQEFALIHQSALAEAHREYLDALQARNEAVIQAWRNSLDLDLLTLSASTSPTGKVLVNPKER